MDLRALLNAPKESIKETWIKSVGADSLPGVQFTEPGTFSIPRLEDPDPHPFDLVAVLSRTAAPYLELIQASGDGIVSEAQCGQILYHGYFEPDMAGRLEWLRTEGPGVDGVFRMDADSPPFSMITSRDPYGNRIEYVGSDAADPLTDARHVRAHPLRSLAAAARAGRPSRPAAWGARR